MILFPRRKCLKVSNEPPERQVRLSHFGPLGHYSPMRTARLACLAVLFPAFVGAQGQQQPLSYLGWGLRISLDSARALVSTQVGTPLNCVGMDAGTLFCQTDMKPGPYVSLYFSPVPRRLEELTVRDPLDRRASKDSLAKWFQTRWGPPVPREVIGKKSTSPTVGLESEVIGSWARDGPVFGMASIASYDTTRLLSVSIASVEREMRLIREQQAARAKAR
jgi:hypothetical protein